MLNSVARWAPGLLALFLIGPMAGWMVGLLRGRDGGQEASLLVNSAPLLGLVVLLGVFALAALSCLIAARFIGFRIATWAAGYTLAWAAYMAGDVPSLIRIEQGGPFVVLAIEGLLTGALALALFLAVVIASKDRETRFGESARNPLDWLKGLPREKSAVAGAIAALIAGGIVAHLINVEPLKGQAIFAAVIAGVAAGAAGAWLGSFVGPTPREPALAVGFCLLAFLGPLSGMVVHGGESALTAANAGTLLGTSGLIGLDWAAGLFMGLPAGVALVESTVEQHTKATA